jgi:amidohydrolase
VSTTAEVLKARATSHVDAIGETIVAVCRTIWEEPELGLQEHRAAALLCDHLDRAGVTPARGIAGMATAFRADVNGHDGGPCVAILAEYDALPRIGHGCGHNIIAASALGAALAVAAVAPYLPGRVRLLGCPAEESAVEDAGGKVPLLREGHFKGVDAAIMVHPGNRTRAVTSASLAARALRVEFHGKAAHAASSPHHGVNALDAVLLTFTAINALRQQVRPDARIHGVITHGGDTPNVIPAYAAARFRVRARDATYLTDLHRRVLACAEGAAAATGTRLEWREDVHAYHNTVPNRTVGAVLERNLRELGLEVDERSGPVGGGSTDFGNVSQELPACHASLAIAPVGTPGHSVELCAAAGSAVGMAAALDGAKLLARAAIDLIMDAETLRRARSEFERAERLAL